MRLEISLFLYIAASSFLSHVQDLSSQRQHCLELPVPLLALRCHLSSELSISQGSKGHLLCTC